jgi:hypothetical protein
LVHFSRTICGRGYSGSAFLGETSEVHRVAKGPLAGSHAPARPAIRPTAINTMPVRRPQNDIPTSELQKSLA